MLFFSVGVYMLIIWVLLAYYIGENEWRPRVFPSGFVVPLGGFSGAHLRGVAERDAPAAIPSCFPVRPVQAGVTVNRRTPRRPLGTFCVIYFTSI
jgi:hypothetical protein